MMRDTSFQELKGEAFFIPSSGPYGGYSYHGDDADMLQIIMASKYWCSIPTGLQMCHFLDDNRMVYHDAYQRLQMWLPFQVIIGSASNTGCFSLMLHLNRSTQGTSGQELWCIFQNFECYGEQIL